MVSYDGVKERVEVVEEVDDLDGLAVGWDGGEAHDVAEIKRDVVKILGFDHTAYLQGLSHRPGENKHYDTTAQKKS